jgi:predicted nuclease with TOPRIM domain
MDFNYEVIAKMAADISKQMLKLNNQLDKIIDKQNELSDPDEQKTAAIELINASQWDEAAKLCAEQAKEDAKRIKLDEEETQVRAELENLREQLVAASNGDVSGAENAAQNTADDSSDA